MLTRGILHGATLTEGGTMGAEWDNAAVVKKVTLARWTPTCSDTTRMMRHESKCENGWRPL